jgi:hypothetical protein
MTPDEQAYARRVDLETTVSLCETAVNEREAMRKLIGMELSHERSAATRDWEISDKALRRQLKSVSREVQKAVPPQTMASVQDRYHQMLVTNDNSNHREALTTRAEEFLLILTHFKEDCARRKSPKP